MADVRLTILGEDKTSGAFRSAKNEVDGLESKMRSLVSVGTLLTTTFAGVSIAAVFKKGLDAVDNFQQSVIQTAAMITSLQGGDNVADNYRRAKEYAEGLQVTLQQVDARTTLNLTSLQRITEEMVKQGVVLDNNNAAQVEAFTRIANAVAVYSRNGADEMQVRQEIRALMMGTVDQNSQLAQLLQRTVDGPLKQQVDKWKQSGTLIEELGKRLSGFGLASEDLNQTWGAVKSSLQTSTDLVLRAGFTGIVKELSEWLNKVNEYLKTHREEVGDKIKSAWETVKTVMGAVADVAKTVWDNFEPFATVIIGGAIIKGVLGIVGVFTSLYRTLITVQGVMIAIGALSGSAAAAGAAAAAGGGAAAAGGAVAGGGVLAAIGGGVAGATIAVGAGVGLGYALQPAVRKLDEWLYKKYGWMLTGEAFYNEQESRNQASGQRLSEVMAKKGQTNGPAVPVVKLQDTPEQVKEKIELMTKELAAYKNFQDQKSALAKGQSEVELTFMKGRFDQGLVSTRAYYEDEKRVALAAAQAESDNAILYLHEEEKVLDFVKAKKGEKSPEYLDELARNQKAIADAQKAQLGYAKTFVESENKMTQALREREAEYAKIIAVTLDATGQYVAAEQAKQAEDEKSIEMLRLRKEAEEGVKGAVAALAAAESTRHTALVSAQNRENEDRRQYASDISSLRDELDKLNGKDQELITSENTLRDGRNKLLSLQDKIALAWAQGNATAISGLSQQIQLQEQLNLRIQDETNLKNRKGELTGTIVGYRNGQPVYADEYSKSQAATGYVSNSQLTGPGNPGQQTGLGFVGLNAPFPYLDVGTPYVKRTGLAVIHEGEAVVTAPENAKRNVGNAGVTITGGIQITVQGGDTAAATVDEIARQLIPKLDEYARRRRAA